MIKMMTGIVAKCSWMLRIAAACGALWSVWSAWAAADSLFKQWELTPSPLMEVAAGVGLIVLLYVTTALTGLLVDGIRKRTTGSQGIRVDDRVRLTKRSRKSYRKGGGGHGDERVGRVIRVLPLPPDHYHFPDGMFPLVHVLFPGHLLKLTAWSASDLELA